MKEADEIRLLSDVIGVEKNFHFVIRVFPLNC